MQVSIFQLPIARLDWQLFWLVQEPGSSSPPGSLLLRCKGLEKRLTGLPWRRDHAELLHQTQNVRVLPAFRDFAISQTCDVD